MTVANPTDRSRSRDAAATQRRLPIGAEVIPDGGGVHFRVWAPLRKTVEVVFESPGLADLPLVSEADGYFVGLAPAAGAGALYRFRLDGEQYLYPDPASRFQPDGPHGPSQVIDPTGFTWADGDWPGIGPEGLVLYEMHVGTFTPEGTWAAAARELPHLKDLGVTCVEVMPVCDFAGKFGWGYDGVDLFAPTRLYGTPDDFRAFVGRAHALGLGVILDVVYNHLGPDGNYLKAFAEHYFTKKHRTDWGDALNFDDADARPVREFFVSNSRYWIDEFHVDGYRFDATQAIVDTSPEHILAAITRAARQAAGRRRIYLVNENEPQHTRLVRPPGAGGYGMDALWNDDFHHSAMTVLSGHNEAYYTDHPGRPQEFVSAAKYGYLFQGQRYSWQKRRRGSPALDLPPSAFVHFIQNHDQIANSGRGLRAHQLSSPGQYRAMTALLLLMPQTPMLFQGQEWAASSTFHYFADHNPELARLVCAGRARELSQFPSVATPEMQVCLLNPADPNTFVRSKLDWSERGRPFHAEVLALHRDLLRLRREEPVFRRVQTSASSVGSRRGDVDGAVLGPDAFVLRYFGEDRAGADDRLLLVNFGTDLRLEPCPEPLLAPPRDRRWAVQLATEDPRYGGSGIAPPDTESEGWFLAGRCATVLRAAPAEETTVLTRMIHAGSAQDVKLIERPIGGL
jgi:maltooligosyltrehalose trehalohydrolase